MVKYSNNLIINITNSHYLTNLQIIIGKVIYHIKLNMEPIKYILI
jgi:hypothetical protein